MGLMSRAQTEGKVLLVQRGKRQPLKNKGELLEWIKRLFKAYLKMIIARVSKLEGGENCVSLTRKVS